LIFFNVKEHQMKQSNERSKLVAELEAAKDELTRAEGELARIEESRNRDHGFFMGAEPGSRHSELLYAVGPLKSRVQVLQDHLAEIDRGEAYKTRVAEAPEQARLAREAWLAAEQKTGELAAAADKIKARLEVLERENHEAEQQAASTESGAAADYAAGIASNDAGIEKAALERLKKIQAASAASRAKTASAAVVIGALRDEFSRLEEQKRTAEAEGQERRRETFEWIAVTLKARWDERADALAATGAKLTAACKRCDPADGLYRLNVPVFAPGRAHIDDDDLDGAAIEINDEALLAEVCHE
jgi:hypothetical protein